MNRNSYGAAPGGLSREAGKSGQVTAFFFDGPEGSLLRSLGTVPSRKHFFPHISLHPS